MVERAEAFRHLWLSHVDTARMAQAAGRYGERAPAAAVCATPAERASRRTFVGGAASAARESSPEANGGGKRGFDSRRSRSETTR